MLPHSPFHGRVARLLFVVSCLSVLLFNSAQADSVIDSTGASLAHFDFAVPDAPAFKLLQVDQNSILRPGTRREVGVILEKTDFKNFAVECAPFLLTHDGEVSRQDYLRKRLLYRLRLSVGAHTTDAGETQGAIGLRLTFRDSGDPYTNKSLVDAAFLLANVLSVTESSANDSMRTEVDSILAHPQTRLPARFLPVAWTDSIRKWKHDIPDMERDDALYGKGGVPDSVRKAVTNRLFGPSIRASTEAFNTLRDNYKNQWNRDIFELGLAGAGSGRDSVASSAKATSYGGWLVGGFRMGPRGQFLVGGRGTLEEDKQSGKLDSGSGGFAVRAYYGSNAVKTSLTADASGKNGSASTYTGELGAEVNIVPSIWVIASVGYRDDANSRSSVTSQLSLRYADLAAIPIYKTLTGQKASTK